MLVLVERVDESAKQSYGHNLAFVASVKNEKDLVNFIEQQILIDESGKAILTYNADKKARPLLVSDLRITEIKDEGQGIILIAISGAK